MVLIYLMQAFNEFHQYSSRLLGGSEFGLLSVAYFHVDTLLIKDCQGQLKQKVFECKVDYHKQEAPKVVINNM